MSSDKSIFAFSNTMLDNQIQKKNVKKTVKIPEKESVEYAMELDSSSFNLAEKIGSIGFILKLVDPSGFNTSTHRVPNADFFRFVSPVEFARAKVETTEVTAP